MGKAELGAPAARTTLVIDRSRWLRGVGTDSMLLRPSDGKMCCLGFQALGCGYTAKEIAGMGDPEDVFRKGAPSLWPPWLLAMQGEDGNGPMPRNTDACNTLIRANDDSSFTENDREERIAAIFAKHGVDVRFVDGASNG